jgi:hypothetical protein
MNWVTANDFCWLQDPDTGRRFEVELQLGRTDETHLIRTIEYWDIEFVQRIKNIFGRLCSRRTSCPPTARRYRAQDTDPTRSTGGAA